MNPLLELEGNSTRFDSVFVGEWGIDLFVCVYLGLVVVEEEFVLWDRIIIPSSCSSGSNSSRSRSRSKSSSSLPMK